jgi:hypothetical protein
MNAEATAENRPAYDPGQHVYIRATWRLTNINVVFKSSSCFFMNSLSYSSASLR